MPKEGQRELRQRPEKSGQRNGAPHKKGHSRDDAVSDSKTGRDSEKGADAEAQHQNKAFEARKQAVCYNCGKTGHFAAILKNGKGQQATFGAYKRELVVNEKPC